jgi:hypothetical protein
LLTVQYRQALGSRVQFRSDREFDVDPSDEATLHLLGIRYYITATDGRYYAQLNASPKFRLIGSADPYYKTFEYLDATPPAAFDAPGGQLEITTWQPEHRSFKVRSNTGGRVMLTEQLFPGWSANVDGQIVPIERWNSAFQSVTVFAGEHSVEFHYSSPGMVLGSLVSLASVVALLWMGSTRYSAGVQEHEKEA